MNNEQDNSGYYCENRIKKHLSPKRYPNYLTYENEPVELNKDDKYVVKQSNRIESKNIAIIGCNYKSDEVDVKLEFIILTYLV